MLDEIEKALIAKEMSPAAASKAAVGNSALIKNMRLGQIPSWEKLERLAQVLDLEFYFGPRRGSATSASTSPGLVVPSDLRSIVQSGITDAGRVGIELDLGSAGMAPLRMTPEQAVEFAHTLILEARRLHEREDGKGSDGKSGSAA